MPEHGVGIEELLDHVIKDFPDVDFSTLLPGPDGVTLAIPDASAGSGRDIPAGRAFFTAITGASPDVYRFSWIGP